MKKITIEVSDHEANVLEVLIKMKGGITDCARTVFVDGLYNHLNNVQKNKDDYAEFKQVFRDIEFKAKEQKKFVKELLAYTPTYAPIINHYEGENS